MIKRSGISKKIWDGIDRFSSSAIKDELKYKEAIRICGCSLSYTNSQLYKEDIVDAEFWDDSMEITNA